MSNKTHKKKTQHHEVSVQDPWFTLIREGLKTVEGRLNKGRFANIQTGDIVRWHVSGTNKSCFTKITNIVHYKTFETMLTTEKINLVLPGVPDITCGVKVYRQFYKKEKERQYGVLAIQLQVIHKTKRKMSIKNISRKSMNEAIQQ